MQTLFFLATIAPAGSRGLHIISVVAVIVFVAIGFYIYFRRHQLFDRDPHIAADEDGPAIRHIRVELVLIVWGALTLVMLVTLYRIWHG